MRYFENSNMGDCFFFFFAEKSFTKSKSVVTVFFIYDIYLWMQTCVVKPEGSISVLFCSVLFYSILSKLKVDDLRGRKTITSFG